MSVVSVLEKILGDVGKGIQIFEGIEPQVYQSIPSSAQPVLQTVTDDLTEIGNAITSASAVVAIAKPGATASDVAIAAVPLVANIIEASEVVGKKKVVNQSLYNQAVQELTQGVTDLLNSLSA